MSLPNSPNRPLSDRENVTEGYQSRPKSILKLRENTTMPIVTGSLRKVSFYNHVELRRFEFTPPVTYSGEESEAQYSDPPEVLSSEFDEHPEEPRNPESSGAHDAEVEERTNNDDESMELTGQLSQIVHLAAMQSDQNGKHESEKGHAHKEVSSAQTAEGNSPVTREEPKETRILEQFRTPVHKDGKRLDDDTNNISFTLSPYQERQILLLPKMTSGLEPESENTKENKKNNSLEKHTDFRPLEALQDYADTLRDSLFNDTANSSPPPGQDSHGPSELKSQATATQNVETANDEETEMELTQQVAVEWTEEVTMELTQIPQPQVRKDISTNHGRTEKTTAESEVIIQGTTRETSKETVHEDEGLPNEESNEDSRASQQEETMELTQPIISHSAPEIETTSDKPEANVGTEPKGVAASASETRESLLSSQTEPSQEQEESTMELTAVYQQEAHMLSVVEEEDENEDQQAGEEAELPMELTQPILSVASPQVRKSPPLGTTPLPKQSTSQSDEIQIDGSIIDRANTAAPVDTPAIIASQRELNRLIEETTPHTRNGVSIGGLGTPMKEPPLPRRNSHTQPLPNDEINLDTPLNHLPNHIHFESDFIPKIATSFAKRSLDPAIELKTSPSKRFSAHGTGEITADNNTNDSLVPEVSLTAFLKDIEVKFFDDLEVGTDLPTAESLERLTNNVFSKEDYYRANIQIPLLEVYELSCKELKGKIGQGKNLYMELQKTANQEVPDLFRKYYHSSYYEQMSMKSHFQVVRDYTREQAKQVWYEWRSKLFKNVSEVLSSNLELLVEDKQAVEARLQDLRLQLETTLATLAGLREDIARFLKIRDQYQQLDSDQIQAMKAKLLELNKQLLAHREAITSEQTRLQEVNERISNQKDTLSHLGREIDDAKLGLMKLKHLSPDEISTLETKSRIIQACSGLQFRKKHSKHIYEFEFSPKMSITVDMENTNSADGLVFHPIDGGVSNLYNESLERYCQAIAETTPFLTIFETLAVFRAKWLKLLSIDEQIYALSMMYPVTIGEYNEQQIDFVMHYYSASTGLKVDFSVSIPILQILEASTSLLISARVLRSRGKTTEKTLQETLSRPIAPHRIFREVKGLKIVK